jgi:glycosyltransferase involved in cell wall biosynthesis
MKVVLFAHPDFLGQQSMPRFTNMLADNLRIKGHEVTVYSPKSYFLNLPAPGFLKKWLGYIDQFLVFPAAVKKRIRRNSDTIYVFTDHALGMWVPIVKHLPNVVICHDFLAQRSANDEIPQNPTSSTGRIYQNLIRKGYSIANNFISVSKKTQDDLHYFLKRIPVISKVVYNGLNKQFAVIDAEKARQIIGRQIGIDLTNGYILHVGGNLWYKNRAGVVEIYSAWRKAFKSTIPLLLVGNLPSLELEQIIEKSSYKNSIYTIDTITDEYINAAYSGALFLLFPSIAEGFGWPIAEAMASGCPVITTNEAPMTEVGGDAALYLAAMPLVYNEKEIWLADAAKQLNKLINLTDEERATLIKLGLANAERFDTNNAISEIENTLIEIKANY